MRAPIGNRMQESGVALITAMLVVALATTAVVSMLSRQKLDIRRTGNILEQDQAMLYAEGAEAWAAAVLQRDLEDNQIDSYLDDWATVLPPIIVDGGEISGAMSDLQGRFNINNLVDDSGVASELDIERLRRLFVLLELDEAMIDPIVDWLDGDIEPRFPSGAEDEAYLALTPAYRTANGKMASLTELRAVRGMTEKIYRVLAPHLVALPQRTAINVNTASGQVLAALAEGLTLDDGLSLAELAKETPFESVDDFLKHDSLAGFQLTADGLAVSSSYFLLQAAAHIGRNRLQLATLLNRQGETIHTVWRSLGHS